MNKLMKQLFRFGIVGGICFLIDFGLLYLLTDVLHIHYFISSAISFLVSVIVNYYMSIKWVFGVEEKNKKQFILFVLISTGGLVINQILLFVMVDFIHIHYLISKFFVTFVVLIYNFVIKKLTLK